MDALLLTFKLIASTLLIVISVYSAIYFGQITRVEQQFGLKLPLVMKKVLGFLTMIPMAVSLVVLLVVLLEVFTY